MKLLLTLFILLLPTSVFAQQAKVVQTCGTVPLSLPVGSTQYMTVDVNGNNCISSSGGSGTVNQGSPNTLPNGWPVKITDGTNGPATVRPGSSPAQATDPALVTTVSPNSSTAPFSAYPTAAITRSSNTTTYTANTGWNNGTPTFFSFANACRVNGGQVLIPQVDVWSSANPTTKLTGILWLFSGVPGTNISDDATFTIAAADFANLTNFSGIAVTLANGQGNTGASNSGVSSVGTNYTARCPAGTTTLTGMFEVTNAYVPVSGEVLTIGLQTVGLN